MGRFFQPWVGANYSALGLNGIRVLIVGESHYGDIGTEAPTTTIEVVERLGRRERFRFFTVVQQLLDPDLNGKVPSNCQRFEFWDKVAFVNYIQSFVGPCPRHRPSEQQWAEAAAAYDETVGQLSPHLILALGAELSRRIAPPPVGTAFAYVPHPASPGFSSEDFREEVQKMLEALARRGDV